MGVVADSGRMVRALRIHVSDGWYPVMSPATSVEALFRRDDPIQLSDCRLRF